MGPEDQVIVLGGDGPPEAAAPPPRRRRWPLVAATVLAALGVIVVLTMAPEQALDPLGTSLEAPPEPPRAFVTATSATIPADTHPLATGWETVRLTGGGSPADVAAGGAGWLAVTEEEGDLIAHTSPNGVLWQARTIPELSGFGVHAVVSDTAMAVVTSGGGSPWPDQPGTAVSFDGGVTWTVTYVREPGAKVEDVRSIEGLIYAFGSIETGEPAATPAAWWWDGATWMLATVSTPGLVTDVIGATDGTVVALGSADGVPAAWEVSPGGLVPLESNTGDVIIVEAVAAPGGGFLALGADAAGSPSGRLLRSDDGRSWSVESVVDSLVGLMAIGQDEFLAIGGDEPALHLVGPDGGSTITVGTRRTRGHLTEVAAVAGTSDVKVVVGRDADGRAALAVRGLTTSPVSLTAPADLRWEVVARADTRWLGYAVRPGVAGGCGDPLIQVASTVWRVQTSDGDPALVEASRGAAPFVGCSPAGPWLVSGVEVAILEGSEWRRIDLPPVAAVAAIGVGAGQEVLLGFGATGLLEAHALGADGSWTQLGGSQPIGGVAALDVGFVGQRFDGPTPITVVSEDGITWTPIEGLLSGSPALPYVTIPDRPGVVRLLDRWPDVEDVSLPAASVTRVVRQGEGFAAQSPGSIWVSTEGATWQRIPAGIENGVGAAATVVPGDPTMLAVADGEVLRLLSLP